jgi:hypothetical protein
MANKDGDGNDELFKNDANNPYAEVDNVNCHRTALARRKKGKSYMRSKAADARPLNSLCFCCKSAIV